MISRNRYDGERMGWDKQSKITRRTGYAFPGDRWRGESEAKPSANERFFKYHFLTYPLRQPWRQTLPFSHISSTSTLVPDTYIVRFVSIPTSYIIKLTHQNVQL